MYNLPLDIQRLIAEYAIDRYPIKIVDWLSKLGFNVRFEVIGNRNPMAIQYIEELINYGRFKENRNYCGIELIKNPIAVDIVRKNKDTTLKHCFRWCDFCENKSIDAIRFISSSIENVLHYSAWNSLCENPFAIDIISERIDKCIEFKTWDRLALNENAIHILHPFLDRLSITGWKNLCTNKNAESILMANLSKIENLGIRYILLSNPCFINSAREHLSRYKTLSAAELIMVFKNPLISEYVDYSMIEWIVCNNIYLDHYIFSRIEYIHHIKKLLESGMVRINTVLSHLSLNPAIFEIDKDMLKIKVDDFLRSIDNYPPILV